MDWNQLHSFLAVAEEGSLSSAARRLGLTQPTLGRHIKQLEDTLGVGLFDRHSQGLRLTERGADLVESVREMAGAADTLARRAAGHQETLAGVVRLSANDVMGIEVLPRALAAFRVEHPQIEVELVISNAASNLSRREADVALRMFRPRQSDLIARRLPDVQLGFYAHRSYLERVGKAAEGVPIFEYDLIGFDQDRQFIDGARALGFTVSERDFVFRCDNIVTHLRAVEAGLGVAGLHVGLARRNPDLVQVAREIPLPPIELWLVCHRDVEHNRRIRALMDFLGGWLEADPYEGPGVRSARPANP